MSNRAAGLSALLLSHVFFCQLLVHTSSIRISNVDYRRVKEHASLKRRTLAIHSADYNYPIIIPLTSNSLVNI